MADLVIDITEPGYGIGYVNSDVAEYLDWSIYVNKDGATWVVWTDDHGHAAGSTLDIAIKRWAKQAGIMHGTADVDYEYRGKRYTLTW